MTKIVSSRIMKDDKINPNILIFIGMKSLKIVNICIELLWIPPLP